MNILLCTLGASWPVIPEIFGACLSSRLRDRHFDTCEHRLAINRGILNF